jgi:WD40 repeat protein
MCEAPTLRSRRLIVTEHGILSQARASGERSAHTSRETRFTLQGHSAAVNGCAVSPDGSFSFSASDDETLKVWDVRTGTSLITFPVEGVLLAWTFHPDGKHLIAAGAGGVYFWEWVVLAT